MPKKGNAQVWAEYLIARSVFGAFSLLPRKAAVSLGFGVGRLGFKVLGGLRKVALKNLRLAYPEMDEQERNRIACGTFENLGRILGEVSQFAKLKPESIREFVDFEFNDEISELYKKIKAERRGVLITTGHLGNWELLVTAFAILYEPISYLARPLDNPKIEQMTLDIRTRFGNKPINKTHSAMTAISKLRDGEILGILADVNAHPKEGVFVPFFGMPACTTSGAAMIAIRANALILPAFCVWDEVKKKYKFVHGPVLEPVNTGDRKADIVATTAAYTAEIEKIIREYPEQWTWIHKRWKTQPKGERDPYRS
ncbi:MAG: lysophospholipid acyltransferase family protein [Pyrinomonadaceae bacterium]|nr:lysophospholipid acyltransferase family protein [Pyrinomonadaceae bacterium]